MKSINSDIASELLMIMDEQRVAVLTTMGKQFPYSCLVSFDVSRDIDYLFFATKRKRQKFENIMKDPRVALVIDDRDNTDFSLHGTNVISLSGIAEDYQGEDLQLLLQSLEKKHPYLKDFLKSEDTSLIRVMIDTIYLVDNFERVRRFE
ncbi:MAG: pyridoxamine 5'-phosphate oxidase family protein [Candidatus Thorarchaeota archaeon]